MCNLYLFPFMPASSARLRLSKDHVAFFHDLRYRATEMYELSGIIEVDAKTGDPTQVQVFFGDSMSSQLPDAPVTFHCHTDAPDASLKVNLSTDVVSPRDMASLGLALTQQGAIVHLVFTPNYSYTISVSSNGTGKLFEHAARANAGTLEDLIHEDVRTKYDALVDQHTQNSGKNFMVDWLSYLKNYGFTIGQYRAQDPIAFEAGQSKRRDAHTEERYAIMTLKDKRRSDMGQQEAQGRRMLNQTGERSSLRAAKGCKKLLRDQGNLIGGILVGVAITAMVCIVIQCTALPKPCPCINPPQSVKTL